MIQLVKVVFIWAAGLLLVAGETPREVPRVHLAGELNVGFELVSTCSKLQYDSNALCNDLKPYTLYGDKSNGCMDYFWCSPEHAACMMACPTGTVFNQACNCCQDTAAATAAAFDTSTCSTAAAAGTEQQVANDKTAPARKLLIAEDSSSNISSNEIKLKPTATEDELRTARAQARLAKRKRREEALRAAAAVSGAAKAAVAADISSNSQPPVAKRRMARRSSRTGVWNSYGKKYTGAWADKNVVKEPAVRVTSTAAGSTPPSAAMAEAVTESAAVAGTARRLLDDNPAAVAVLHSAAANALAAASSNPRAAAPTMRAMKMKRVQRLAAQAAAAAAAGGDPADTAATADAIVQQVHGGEHHKFKLRQKIRPMDKKPAAKAIDPEDEKGAPFAAALALTADPEQH